MIILYFYFYNDFFVSIYDLFALLVELVADVYYCQDHNHVSSNEDYFNFPI